jgi:sugar transferase (PEP-CTERM system associated)
LVRLFNVYYPTRIIFLLFGEVAVLCASFLAAGLIHFGTDFSFVLNYHAGLAKIGLVSGVCLVCIYYFDLYDTGIVMNQFEILTRLVQVLGATCIILAILYYLFPGVQLEPRFLGLGLLFAGICLAGLRKLFLLMNKSAMFAERAVILGSGPLAASLATEFQKRPELGVRLTGCVTHVSSGDGDSGGLPRLGDIEDLPSIVQRGKVKQVIVAMRERRGRLPVELLMKLKTRGVTIQNGEDVYESLAGQVPLDSFRLSWLLFSTGPTISKAKLFYKRLASVVLSGLALAFALPLLPFIILAIRLDSKGPILFSQDRVGKDGKTFKLYKFRSMREGGESDGVFKPAKEDDARITRVGKGLRRTRLDEVPQLFNILRGDMYFVGPRPFVPNQENECVEKIPFYTQRWIVKPGATGWAQINLGYCATVEDNTAKLAHDLFYIKNMSMGLDLLIVFRTIKVLLLGRGSR